MYINTPKYVIFVLSIFVNYIKILFLNKSPITKT